MVGADRGAAERAAETIANVVGDGCVVRLYDSATGGLEAAAVAHRDRERRQLLSELLGGPALSPDLGWVADAFQRNVAFRLRHGAAAEAIGSGAGPDDVHAAVAAPFRLAGRPAGVVVALRDSTDFGYSLAEQQIVQELAAVSDAPAPSGQEITELGGALRILEVAPGAVWVTDLGGVTTYVNHAACELAGIPSSALLGTDIGDYFDVVPQPPVAEPVDQRLQRPDGSTVWVSLATAPLSDDSGRVIGTVRTLTDVSERRRVEVAARMSAAASASIAELTEHALAGEEFAVLADEAVELVADLFGAEYVALGEVCPGRESLVPRAVTGWPREVIGARFPLAELSAPSLCLDEDGPVVIRDYTELDRLVVGEMVTRSAVRSAFFVRVAGGAGILSAHSPQPGAFTHQDLSALGLLTSVISARWEPRLAPLVAVS